MQEILEQRQDKMAFGSDQQGQHFTEVFEHMLANWFGELKAALHQCGVKANEFMCGRNSYTSERRQEASG